MTNKMPVVIRERAVQIANHEMGHYVVARALGFETGGVSLTVTAELRHQGGATITLARPISSMDAMKAHLETRIMVLFAGVMAEALCAKKPVGKRVDQVQALHLLQGDFGAQQDYAKIRELRHLLRNIEYPETHSASSERIAVELKIIHDRLWFRTHGMVEAFGGAILELGNTLVDSMTLVEQWGRPADTYEVIMTREMLERLGLGAGDFAGGKLIEYPR